MLDPVAVAIPPLTDGVIELAVLERYPIGDASVPAGYMLAVLLVSTHDDVGRLLVRLDAAAPAFAGNIAYEIAPEHRGHGYALRACRVIAPLLRLHLDVAWIMVAPDNLASLRTVEQLGAEYVDTRMIPEYSDMRALGIEQVRRHRWSLTH